MFRRVGGGASFLHIPFFSFLGFFVLCTFFSFVTGKKKKKPLEFDAGYTLIFSFL